MLSLANGLTFLFSIGSTVPQLEAPHSEWHTCPQQNKKNAPTVGLEPTTTRLRALRSTN